MAEPKEPCSHQHLDPDTKKCKDCGNQIYPLPTTMSKKRK
jgi:hypothetical protein